MDDNIKNFSSEIDEEYIKKIEVVVLPSTSPDLHLLNVNKNYCFKSNKSEHKCRVRRKLDFDDMDGPAYYTQNLPSSSTLARMDTVFCTINVQAKVANTIVSDQNTEQVVEENKEETNNKLETIIESLYDELEKHAAVKKENYVENIKLVQEINISKFRNYKISIIIFDGYYSPDLEKIFSNYETSKEDYESLDFLKEFGKLDQFK